MVTLDGPALVKAIRDQPDDDTVRLVYADYLQEQGQDERAEFVRVEVALGAAEREYDECLKADIHHTDPTRQAVTDRIASLRPRSNVLWTLGIAVGGFLDLCPAAWGGAIWHRGCIENLTGVVWENWLAYADAILERHPVRRVTLATPPDVRFEDVVRRLLYTGAARTEAVYREEWTVRAPGRPAEAGEFAKRVSLLAYQNDALTRALLFREAESHRTFPGYAAVRWPGVAFDGQTRTVAELEREERERMTAAVNAAIIPEFVRQNFPGMPLPTVRFGPPSGS